MGYHRSQQHMDEKQRKRTSKYLTKILRHQPHRIGLSLEPGGWVGLGKLFAAFERHGVRISPGELLETVVRGGKPRFTLSTTEGRSLARAGERPDGDVLRLMEQEPSRLRIRANYGHSLQVDLGIEPTRPPELLFHGTAEQTLPAVRREGLRAMGRQFVHLYEEPEAAREVGSRHGRPILLGVRSDRMHAAGYAFYRAERGIWLTAEVPPEMLQLPEER